MLWTYRNIEARIWPLDHCPPHVTFVSRAGNWTARFKFCMFSSRIEIWDIKPLKNAPSWNLINELANQVDKNLVSCREEWWSFHKDVCLDNKEVERAGPGIVRLGNVVTPVGKVIAKSGRYQPAANGKADEVVVNVKWPNNSVTQEQVVE